MENLRINWVPGVKWFNSMVGWNGRRNGRRWLFWVNIGFPWSIGLARRTIVTSRWLSWPVIDQIHSKISLLKLISWNSIYKLKRQSSQFLPKLRQSKAFHSIRNPFSIDAFKAFKSRSGSMRKQRLVPRCLNKIYIFYLSNFNFLQI